jgi:hypothetical protein
MVVGSERRSRWFTIGDELMWPLIGMGIDVARDVEDIGVPLFFAVFAVFAGNYQRAMSFPPQKSWSSGNPAEQGTAGRSAVTPVNP